MELLVVYNAPLPVDFVSGTLEIKGPQVYIDGAGRKAQAYQKAVIGANRSLTDVQSTLPLTIIGSGPEEPLGSPIDWVETLIVTHLPDPLRQTKRIPRAYTRPGIIDLHLPGGLTDPGGVLPVRDPTVLPSVFEGQNISVVHEIDYLTDPGRVVYFGVVANIGNAPFQVRHHVAGQAGTPMTVAARSSREWIGGRTALSLLPVNGQPYSYSVVVS